MEKPSTKKPMNVLKTMVFLKNFMKYYIAIDNCLIRPKIKYYKTKKEVKEDKNFLYDVLIKGKVIDGRLIIHGINCK